jgi:hypothetical protein
MHTRRRLGTWALALAAAVLLYVQRPIAQGGPGIPYPLVFASRQIPDRGTIYWNVPRAQPGVGAHSRFRLAAPGQLVVREPNGTLRVLVDGTAPTSASLHLIDVNAPDVSYDGQWIVFAGLPQGSHDAAPANNPNAWRIYVIGADGSGLRRVSPDEDRAAIPSILRAYDDTDPVWLPDGRIAFASTRWPAFGHYSGVRVTNLYVVDADGTDLRRITAERNGAERPLVDPVTGKIVFARWWRNHRFPLDDMSTIADPNGGYRRHNGLSAERNVQMDGSPQYADHLFRNAWHAAAINPDGTGLALWGGSQRNQAASGNDERNHMYGGGFAPNGDLYANYFPMYNMTEAAGFGGLRRFSRGALAGYTPVAGITTLGTTYVNPSNPTSYGVYPGPYVTEPEVLPDGRLVVSRALDVNQDYGLAVMNADGTGVVPVYDRAGTTELRVRAIRPRPIPPVIADTVTQVPSRVPPTAAGPYDVDGTFVFDALNVYANAPVDVDIISAPAIGSAATIRFFIDHQRTSMGSFPNLDWPILLGERAVAADGSVREPAAPANVPLFEQLRRADGRVPLTGGPEPTGAAHVAGMNYGRPGTTARCVGCHIGHTLIPVPATDAAAKWSNLAPGAAIEVSSTRDAAYNRGLIDRRVLKGEIWRYWTAATGQHENQWAKLTFPVPIRVHKVRLYNPRPGGEANSSLAIGGATVRLYSDAAATQQVAVQTVGALTVGGTDATFTPAVARAVRVEIGAVTGTFYGARTASLAEIEVIASGDVSGTAPPPEPDDTDGDGLPDDWEARFGIGPGSANADDDPDGDDLSNAEEHRRGTHPRGTTTKYFSEGAENTFFATRFALLNPGAQPARVLLRFEKSSGVTVSQFVDLPARRRATVEGRLVADLAGHDFSTVIESDQPIVADRSMTWTAADGYGSHAASSIPAPALTWYLAEGATHGAFDLFYLLHNPSDTASEVRVQYLRPSGAPLERTYTVPARTRQTIYVDEEVFPAGSTTKALAATDVSATIQVQNGVPIIVERSMYLSEPGRPFGAGHNSAGVTQPATSWFLAEGATGAFFDLYLLLANPGDQDADVQVTYLQPDGRTLVKTYLVRARSRYTVSVDTEEFPTGSGQRPLENAAVSSIVESRNGVPIIVERSMWWPSGAWTEAHGSPGATTTAARWAVAEGEAGGAANTQAYVLIANTSTAPGSARVTVLYEDGNTAEQTIALPASSRTNVDVASRFAGSTGRRFGVLVESLGLVPGSGPAQLVVEYSLYTNAGGAVWAAGSNALATPLP